MFSVSPVSAVAKEVKSSINFGKQDVLPQSKQLKTISADAFTKSKSPNGPTCGIDCCAI